MQHTSDQIYDSKPTIRISLHAFSYQNVHCIEDYCCKITISNLRGLFGRLWLSIHKLKACNSFFQQLSKECTLNWSLDELEVWYYVRCWRVKVWNSLCVSSIQNLLSWISHHVCLMSTHGMLFTWQLGVPLTEGTLFYVRLTMFVCTCAATASTSVHTKTKCTNY
jgi:hypothetical protein